MSRLLVVLALVAGVAVVAAWYRTRRRADETRGAAGLPPVPTSLVAATPTWLIFTTPFCASCEAVRSALEAAFPHHQVTKVDATEQVELAERYDVRRAPTTLLADPTGRVLQRLVGPEAVRDFIGSPDAVLLTDA